MWLCVPHTLHLHAHPIHHALPSCFPPCATNGFRTDDRSLLCAAPAPNTPYPSLCTHPRCSCAACAGFCCSLLLFLRPDESFFLVLSPGERALHPVCPHSFLTPNTVSSTSCPYVLTYPHICLPERAASDSPVSGAAPPSTVTDNWAGDAADQSRMAPLNPRIHTSTLSRPLLSFTHPSVPHPHFHLAPTLAQAAWIL